MKRAEQSNLNTTTFWNEYWGGPRSKHEGNPCPDVAFMLTLLSAGRKKFLDVGCGAGPYFPFVASDHIYGIDISSDGIDRAQVSYPNARLIAGDVSKGLPYPDGEFDIVYCGEMVEHMENPGMLVGELHRVLCAGGVCVLNTPFEDKIPASSHLWYINRSDLAGWFKIFGRCSIYRFDNSPTKDWWEHFLVVAVK